MQVRWASHSDLVFRWWIHDFESIIYCLVQQKSAYVNDVFNLNFICEVIAQADVLAPISKLSKQFQLTTSLPGEWVEQVIQANMLIKKMQDELERAITETDVPNTQLFPNLSTYWDQLKTGKVFFPA